MLTLGCRLEKAVPGSPAGRTAPSTAPVAMAWRRFVDSSRPSWSEPGPRPLTTVVWYPTDSAAAGDTIWLGPPNRHQFRSGVAAVGAPIRPGASKLPLIVLSHGTGGSALQLMWLGQRLASAGYIVAAVNHHGNTGAEPKYLPQGFVLWWERAIDLSRVVDRMLADSVFGPRIDSASIGAAGFSLGGYTMIELAGGRTDLTAFEKGCHAGPAPALCEGPPEFPDLVHQLVALEHDSTYLRSRAHAGDSYRDPRIKAVYAIAPALGVAFTPSGLAGISIPVSISVGSADLIAPPSANAGWFAQQIRRARVYEVPGAGHYTFLSECTSAGIEDLPLLCRDEAGADRRRIHEEISDSAAAFFREELRSH
ncbi:MAG TPA: hypothetical protein VMJ30_08550 [Gemmatimonadales bacterium]|nr:hypothetical protein [Gemmatimonadales bacterium]